MFYVLHRYIVTYTKTHSLAQQVMRSRCGVPGAVLNAPKADADTRSDAGE
jgi:hypothetical protein